MAENDNSPGARVRDLRRQQGLTQGQLAERAGVSERTIANFEGDATFRMPTALAIARALGVETVWFGAPGRRTGPADYREILLARHVDAFRSVLLLNEFRQDDAPPRDIKAIRADVARLGQLYSAKQMDEIAALGLALLTESQLLDVNRETAAVNSAVLNLCGRYLILSNAIDLAIVALRRAKITAEDYDLTALTGLAVDGLMWAKLRIGTLDEVERIAAEAADNVKPKDLENADAESIASWGWALSRASAAAARNNRPEAARDYVQAMGAAACALPTVFRSPVISFGATSVSTTATENALLAGQPDQALRAAQQDIPAGHRISGRLRHRVDVAMAHAQLRQLDAARETLNDLAEDAPAWLAQQQSAVRVLDQIKAAFKGPLPSDMVQLYSSIPAT